METWTSVVAQLSECQLSVLGQNHGVERGATSDAFLGGGKNERCGNFKVSILSLINFSF